MLKLLEGLKYYLIGFGTIGFMMLGIALIFIVIYLIVRKHK